MPIRDQSDGSAGQRGRYKIFMGYAPGCGKTFALLDEAQRRNQRGQDVVIGHMDSYGRRQTEEIGSSFTVIPTTSNGDLDIDAIVARMPGVVIVDELAHVNAPGSRFQNRWEDVEYLLDHGISVLSTITIYQLESLNDQVFDIAGIRIPNTVPDRVLHEAEEVEIVDVTPQALLNRLKRGDIYTNGQPPSDIAPIFDEAVLSALREISLREAAGRVDEDLVEYRRDKRIEKPWAAKDRVMICISPTRSSLRLIRRGWRMGQRMHGDVIAVHVKDGTSESESAKKILADDLKLASKLGLETVTLEGSLAPTLIKFARDRNVTAVILGHPERSRLQEIMKPSILSELARELRTVDIIVVSTEVETNH